VVLRSSSSRPAESERYSKYGGAERYIGNSADALVYLRRLAELTPAERVRAAVALWEAAHSLQWAAARHRNPDADDAEIVFQIAVTRFGAELARTVYRRV
jgi:hypothetical protein